MISLSSLNQNLIQALCESVLVLLATETQFVCMSHFWEACSKRFGLITKSPIFPRSDTMGRKDEFIGVYQLCLC